MRLKRPGEGTFFSSSSKRSCAADQNTGETSQDLDVPTFTAVFPSSSDARLPPFRLLMLKRLLLRGVRIIALMGRGAAPAGDAGGETVILPRRNHAGWVKGGDRGQTSVE